MSIPKPSSDTLIEMCYESEPAKWAAHQISTKGYGLKTVGEAMDMIEAIVKEAIKMSHTNAESERDQFKLDNIRHRSAVQTLQTYMGLDNTKEGLRACLLAYEAVKSDRDKAKALCAAMAGAQNSPTWPHVLEFALRMEKKLSVNRHKGDRGGWLNDDPLTLHKRLAEEDVELKVAMENGLTAEEIANEAADVANFAMMIADWFTARVEGQ